MLLLASPPPRQYQGKPLFVYKLLQVNQDAFKRERIEVVPAPLDEVITPDFLSLDMYTCSDVTDYSIVPPTTSPTVQQA